MALEIERKFLVDGEFKSYAVKQKHIVQGYLSSHPERSVRVRIKDNKAYITIKGIANDSGLSRYEWEKEIPVSEAMDLIRLCEPGVIDKTRYYIPSGDLLFEVDEFHGENQGLVMAELELETETQDYIRPEWLGEEVTGDTRYYNSSLTKMPYTKW